MHKLSPEHGDSKISVSQRGRATFWHEIWTECFSEGHSNPSITLKPNSPRCYSHSVPLHWNQTAILIIAAQTRVSESWSPLEWFCARVNECSQWNSILSAPWIATKSKTRDFHAFLWENSAWLPSPPSSLPAKKQLICQSFKMGRWNNPRTVRIITSQHLQSTSFLSPLPHKLFNTFSALFVCSEVCLSSLETFAFLGKCAPDLHIC